jgi:hypothetical protein
LVLCNGYRVQAKVKWAVDDNVFLSVGNAKNKPKQTYKDETLMTKGFS